MARHMRHDVSMPKTVIPITGMTWRQLRDELNRQPDWRLDTQATVYLDRQCDIRMDEENPIVGITTYYMDDSDDPENTLMLCIADKED